jgi:prepilin-type N-terminal cleavage/methylation domain-containing protein
MHARTLASRAGFTLVEVMLAATMGALLLAAAASSSGTFAETVAHLDAGNTDKYESALARIDRDVRYAWSVSVPDRSQLLVTGPDGLLTQYHLVGSDLIVTRPDGSSGALLSGLTTFGFNADSQQRLRSGASTTVSGVIGSLSAPGGTSAALMQLSGGNSVALSFMGNSNAGARSVAGTNDRISQWTLTSIELPLAGVGLGTVNFAIYPATGPGRGDPRSAASALASWSLALAALPVGSFTIRGGHVTYTPPATLTAVAVPSLVLQPGVAYTLVIDFAGAGNLNLALYGSTSRRDEVSRSGGGAWSPLAGAIPFTVHGDATCTTTTATTVTTQVRTTLQSGAGDTYVGSACVYSQVLAPDAWLGVVPGEVPAGP